MGTFFNCHVYMSRLSGGKMKKMLIKSIFLQFQPAAYLPLRDISILLQLLLRWQLSIDLRWRFCEAKGTKSAFTKLKENRGCDGSGVGL